MGFTDTAPLVTCQQISIDPPIGVQIHFLGDIGTHKGVDLVAPYVGADHMARVDISNLTTQSGPIHYAFIATGNFGVYGNQHSQVAVGTIACHDAPSTTTTSTTIMPTTTTVLPTTTSTIPTTTTMQIGTPVTAHSAPGASVALVPSATRQLPNTGSADGVLAVAGGGFLMLGLVAIVGAARLRKSRR